jgi:hypothetical protein
MSNLTKQEIENLNQLKNCNHLQAIELVNTIDLLQNLLIEAMARVDNSK